MYTFFYTAGTKERYTSINVYFSLYIYKCILFSIFLYVCRSLVYVLGLFCLGLVSSEKTVFVGAWAYIKKLYIYKLIALQKHPLFLCLGNRNLLIGRSLIILRIGRSLMILRIGRSLIILRIGRSLCPSSILGFWQRTRLFVLSFFGAKVCPSFE